MANFGFNQQDPLDQPDLSHLADSLLRLSTGLENGTVDTVQLTSVLKWAGEGLNARQRFRDNKSRILEDQLEEVLAFNERLTNENQALRRLLDQR